MGVTPALTECVPKSTTMGRTKMSGATLQGLDSNLYNSTV